MKRLGLLSRGAALYVTRCKAYSWGWRGRWGDLQVGCVCGSEAQSSETAGPSYPPPPSSHCLSPLLPLFSSPSSPPCLPLPSFYLWYWVLVWPLVLLELTDAPRCYPMSLRPVVLSSHSGTSFASRTRALLSLVWLITTDSLAVNSAWSQCCLRPTPPKVEHENHLFDAFLIKQGFFFFNNTLWCICVKCPIYVHYSVVRLLVVN